MITGLKINTIWVLDQDSALEFYTKKLGFEVRSDTQMGPDSRWVTVGAADQPDLELALMLPGPPAVDPESAEQLKVLVAKGILGAGVMATDDCQATYEELSARGVEFVQPPKKRPYGVEALFRDDSGNWFSLTERSETLDESIGWD
ncbi:Glyoxalase/bleomycin resistance protein/dioxygenase [Catenulispora acidiphila DSM 44928]|uniref:Glyoxalase/bleomycin resistance protein/dioxygenase n=1 Tax=Catenulispora acidiphila (strain DSM 44928 / JCM 14897 / NBRC 102108 / NRRL B-24433 / ID139908) TaxID=479433 RepID=C7QAN1_CATAD|nr:VOC family protein [Catenulispora acidiphila]ACU72530.1 Glyoxalase/bleomycin resistance protein/dioxygenase [Catenulispora acidiphila DSM 44928]